MTDIHHSSDLFSVAGEARTGANWGTILAGALAVLIMVGATHLTNQESGGDSQVHNAEKGKVNLDGRGKWIGYM